MSARIVTAAVILVVVAACSATLPSQPELTVGAPAPSSTAEPTQTAEPAAPTAEPAAPTAVPAATAAQQDALADWFGLWRGTLNIRNNAGESEVKMSLDIEPLAEGRYAWRIRYEGESVRDYELIAVDPDAGIYEVDEKNGIVLTATLVGSTVYTLFSLDDKVLDVRYTLTDEGLRFDVVTSIPSKTTPTGGGDVPDVDNLAVIDVQQALLIRFDEES